MPLNPLLVVSIITPTDAICLPATTTSLIDVGMVKFNPKVSHCSKILSLVIGTLITLLVVPAWNVALIGVES